MQAQPAPTAPGPQRRLPREPGSEPASSVNVISTPPPGSTTDRVMRVDFAGFTRNLVAMGEPSKEDARNLAAGFDLLTALESCSAEFGAAAPGASEDATLAETIAALTDEAFEVAAGVIEDNEEAEAGGWAGAEDARAPTARAALGRALSDAAFDAGLGAHIRGTLLEIAPRADPSVGAEFV